MSGEMTKLIQEAIRATGLPILEIARRAGVSQPQLSRFMKNERTLTLPAAEKICEALGLRLTAETATASKLAKQAKTKRERA
jgi:transcriptional regulator with XRE-family HTH domain